MSARYCDECRHDISVVPHGPNCPRFVAELPDDDDEQSREAFKLIGRGVVALERIADAVDPTDRIPPEILLEIRNLMQCGGPFDDLDELQQKWRRAFPGDEVYCRVCNKAHRAGLDHG